MSTVKITIGAHGLDDMIQAMRDLQGAAQRHTQEYLDQALDRTLEASEALAHVSLNDRHAGALKASGQARSEHGAGGWTGTISYANRGAAFEMQRGGEHSQFIDSLGHVSEPNIEQALGQMINGGDARP